MHGCRVVEMPQQQIIFVPAIILVPLQMRTLVRIPIRSRSLNQHNLLLMLPPTFRRVPKKQLKAPRIVNRQVQTLRRMRLRNPGRAAHFHLGRFLWVRRVIIPPPLHRLAEGPTQLPQALVRQRGLPRRVHSANPFKWVNFIHHPARLHPGAPRQAAPNPLKKKRGHVRTSYVSPNLPF